MKRIVAITLLLLISIPCYARAYRTKDIPNVQLENRYRFTSNPDGVLEEWAVAKIDSICYDLRHRGIAQTAVVAVEEIDSDDVFEFAYELFSSWGVGSKSDSGIGILLVEDAREIRFITGYGVEGALPDAICKRIQSKYMVQHLSKEDWNTGMLEGIRVVGGYLDGSMINELREEGENDLGFVIMGLLFLFPAFLILYKVLKPSTSRCPQCKKRTTTVIASKVLSKTEDYEDVEKYYTCQNCGQTFIKTEKHYFLKVDGSEKSSDKFISSSTDDDNEPRGGSYGGGNFGGGGAGSKF
jgi:uncharacterized protein